jgi:hypothetical protein
LIQGQEIIEIEYPVGDFRPLRSPETIGTGKQKVNTLGIEIQFVPKIG